jgi:soluble lytic murein transglycosylase-like protein
LTLNKLFIHIVRWASCAVVCVGVAAPAMAQIYSWNDANGNLVLSNRPRPGAAPVHSYAVPKTENVRATRFVPTERGRLYDDLISEHARLNGVRTDLVKAVVQVESGFNPYAKSPKGALGLMQLMPATIQRFGVRNPFNPVENVRAGAQYLRQLLDRYQNNEQLALAAYNAGPEAVDKHGQKVPPYRETENYVSQISQIAERPLELRSNQIYRVTEIIDGRAVTRYTDKKPSKGSYDVVGTR